MKKRVEAKNCFVMEFENFEGEGEEGIEGGREKRTEGRMEGEAGSDGGIE